MFFRDVQALKQCTCLQGHSQDRLAAAGWWHFTKPSLTSTLLSGLLSSWVQECSGVSAGSTCGTVGSGQVLTVQDTSIPCLPSVPMKQSPLLLQLCGQTPRNRFFKEGFCASERPWLLSSFFSIVTLLAWTVLSRRGLLDDAWWGSEVIFPSP